jgi:hypothetical protein
MTRQPEGTAEIDVYFEPGIPEDTKVTFIQYIHDHLHQKAQSVTRLRHYVCPFCNTPVEIRRTARVRLEQGLKDILCVNCESRVPLWDFIEQRFASEKVHQRVHKLEEQAQIYIDNESPELILVGHAFAIASEAGQILRATPGSDWGIDGEIEFKNDQGEASGQRVYLQLKSGDFFLNERKSDNKEIFRIKTPRHAEHWMGLAHPVMLVVRTSDGRIRWMDVTEYIRKHGTKVRQIVFEGEPFTVLSMVRLRDKLSR